MPVYSAWRVTELSNGLGVVVKAKTRSPTMRSFWKDGIKSDIKGEHNFALRVKGDSMESEFNDGDIIIVNPTAKAETGDYVVAKNDEKEATFKQY